MFEEAYRRAAERRGPDEGQMARLLDAVDRAGARSGRGRPLRVALLAAALCALLCATALAVSPTLREALLSALGSFAPYRQDIEGLSVVDQGIEVKVVSALSDGNVAQVYYEIRDLTGDRLDKYLYVPHVYPVPINWGEEDGSQWAGFGGLVQYDDATKTALMATTITGDGPPAEELILGLDISTIEPGYRSEVIPVDPNWIAEGALRSETTENGKSVLVSNQNPRELESEFFSLSSYGFGEDGVLHLQLRVKEGVDDSQWELGLDDVRYSGGWSRSDTAPDYSRTNRYGQSVNYAGMTEEERELASPNTRFRQDGVTYYDCRTGITPADVAEGDVEWWEYASVSLNTRPIIRGEWSLEIPVEMVDKTSVDMGPSQTTLEGVTAKTLHLSVLGCTLESDPGGNAGTLGYLLTVYLSDGTVIAGIDSDGLFHAGRYAVNHWTFPQPVEPEEVTAIALGLWYIPLEGGAAQPGHWLAEMPTGQNP